MLNVLYIRYDREYHRHSKTHLTWYITDVYTHTHTHLTQTALGEGVMAAQACLTELDLSDNAFGPAGVEALIGFLTSPSCFSLKVVRFNNNGLGSKGGTVS